METIISAKTDTLLSFPVNPLLNRSITTKHPQKSEEEIHCEIKEHHTCSREFRTRYRLNRILQAYEARNHPGRENVLKESHGRLPHPSHLAKTRRLPRPGGQRPSCHDQHQNVGLRIPFQ